MPAFETHFWGPRAWPGPHISDSEAVEFTAVYRALNIIASTLGTLPIHVFDRRKTENDVVRSESTRYLWGSPNREDTRFKFWSGLFADQVMDGNAFIHVVKNDAGNVLQLWDIDPARVEVGRLGADFGFLKVYRIDHQTPAERLMFDYSAGGEIVHVTGRPDPHNRLIGFNPRRSLYRTLSLAKNADELSASLADNDNTPPGVLSTDQELTTEQAKDYQERWQERERGRIAVLGHGMTFEKIGLSPLESETLDSRRFSVTEIFRHFGIPSHLGNDTEKTTSWGSGLFEITKAFQSYTLAHCYVAFEQAVEKHLLGEGNLYMRYEMGGLLRGSLLEQYQAHRIALGGAPWLTPNEVRELDSERGPVDGGDVLAIPLNMANTGSLPGEDAQSDPNSAAKEAVKAAEIVLEGGTRTTCPDCGGFIGHNARGTIRCPKCNELKVFA